MPEPNASASTPETPAASRARLWAPRIASAFLVPAVLLVLLELALRLFGVGYSTDLTVPCTIQGRPASCYNLFFPAPFFPPGMIKTPQAYAIPAQKPRGTYRIFVLGESAAMGDPDPAYAFSRYLEVMLRERFPAIKFEVVNTGSVAINSHVLLPIAQGLAQQRPDLFIIYSGNNEVVGPYGPGTALTSGGMSLPVIRAGIFVHSSRIGQLLTQVGAQKKEWGGMEMFLDKQVPASSPLMPYVYENFERNLRDTVEAARRSGARVIVSTVATNLKDCSPFASLHRDGLSPDDLRSWNALVQQGAELETARSYADALKAYQAASKIDDQYAELEFRIARAHWMQGDYAAAKQHYSRARDLDTLRFRADSKINDINRAVAKSSGAELVDAEAIFSSYNSGSNSNAASNSNSDSNLNSSPASGPASTSNASTNSSSASDASAGVIGSDLVYEHVHMTPLGNYLLARAMFQQIASKLQNSAGDSADSHLAAGRTPGMGRDSVAASATTPAVETRLAASPAQPPDPPSQTECEQLLAFTNHDRSRIANDMLQRLQKPPFTNQLNHSDQVLRLMFQAQTPTETPDETAAQYEWAIRKNPTDRVLHYAYGLFLFDHNRDAAVGQLRQSRPWDGFPVFTPDGMLVE